jgi:hypothetical protein
MPKVLAWASPVCLKAIKIDRSLMVIREWNVGNRPDVVLLEPDRIA